MFTACGIDEFQLSKRQIPKTVRVNNFKHLHSVFNKIKAAEGATAHFAGRWIMFMSEHKDLEILMPPG